jgi:hypothetical protein
MVRDQIRSHQNIRTTRDHPDSMFHCADLVKPRLSMQGNSSPLATMWCTSSGSDERWIAGGIEAPSVQSLPGRCMMGVCLNLSEGDRGKRQ